VEDSNGGLFVFPNDKFVFPEGLFVFPNDRFVFPEGLFVFPNNRFVFPERLFVFPNNRFVFPERLFVLPESRGKGVASRVGVIFLQPLHRKAFSGYSSAIICVSAS
jgi:hypothetical protein